MRFDGAPAPGVTAQNWLFNNNLEWNAYRGWLFGCITNASGYRLDFYTQRQHTDSSFILSTGVWYDVALVVNCKDPAIGSVEFYAVSVNTTLYYTAKTNIGITNSLRSNPSAIIGGEEHKNGYGASTYYKSFKGAIDHLALWNRALSYEEVWEALSFPRPGFQVGLDNNTIKELRIENQANAVFTAGDPWHTMPRALSVDNPSITLKIPLRDVVTNCNHVFHINTGSSGNAQPVKILLTVNGEHTAHRETFKVYPNSDYYWPIAKERLNAGVNTFVLTYIAGPSAYMNLDFIELAGAWQMGVQDNDASTDFIMEDPKYSNFWAGDPYWMRMSRAISTGAAKNALNIHFNLSSQLMETASFEYTTRIVAQGRASGTLPEPPYPFQINLNSNRVYESESGVADGTTVMVPLPSEYLQRGINTLQLQFNSTNGWLQFDFHRLSTELWQLPDLSGTVLLLQ